MLKIQRFLKKCIDEAEASCLRKKQYWICSRYDSDFKGYHTIEEVEEKIKQYGSDNIIIFKAEDEIHIKEEFNIVDGE